MRMLSVLRLGVVFYCLYFHDAFENVVEGHDGLYDARFIQLADINIGILLPMTIPQFEPACTWLNLGYARYAKLIAYAVERVNKERPLISNLTMGYVILDNCFREDVNSDRSMVFVPQDTCPAHRAAQSQTQFLSYWDVVAVMVANSNIFTEASCSPLNSGQVPHVSILSNNDDLTHSYAYFTTVIPSNRHLFNMISTLLHKYGWTYVLILATEYHFSSDDLNVFMKSLDAKEICFQMMRVVYPLEKNNMAFLVKKLRVVRKLSRVVVILTQEEHIAKRFIFDVSLMMQAGELIWIITTPVHNIDKQMTDLLIGSLIVDVKDFNVPEFDDWLVQRKVLALLSMRMLDDLHWIELSMLSQNKPDVVLTCSWPPQSVASFLISNCPLMVGSAMLAFKTRHLPNTFNESHFILICVCTTLIVFISFIPTYLTTIYELTKVQILAIILILNHSVAVTFLFMPKIYSVLYRRELQMLSSKTYTRAGRKKLTNTTSISSSGIRASAASQETFVRNHSPVISPPADRQQKTKEAVQSDIGQEAVRATSVSSAKKHETKEAVQSDTGSETVSEISAHVLNKHDPSKGSSIQSGTLSVPSPSPHGHVSDEDHASEKPNAAESLVQDTADILHSATGMFLSNYEGS